MHKCNKRVIFGERRREIDSFGIYYTRVTYYIIIIHSKIVKREREIQIGEREERERDQNIIIKDKNKKCDGSGQKVGQR